jgi:hypothetical protein
MDYNPIINIALVDIINTVRKYYFDLLAKRKGTTASILNNPIPPMP